MSEQKLRIAYLCDISPLDRNLYSGGNARIFESLQKHAGDVTILSNSWHLAEPLRRAIMASPEAINLRLRWRAHLALGRVIASGVRRELKRGQYDVLFGAYSFQSMFRMKTPYPMVTAFTADATPTTYKQSDIGQSFGSYLSASRVLDPLFLRAETQTFRNIDLMLWPSDWLKTAADRLYDLSDQNSVVVPWGANVADPGIGPQQPKLSPNEPVRLLFVGRDWFAKGGPLVFETLKALKDRGVPVELTVIGCHPPEFHRDPAMIIHGPLHKDQPEDLAKFQSAMRNAHFVMQPSFESYGFAFCEASAFGLPSVCLRVGGVPVRDGINGHALPLGSTADDFADIVQDYIADPARYEALRKSARNEYEERLNWDAWGQKAAALLRDRVNALRSS